MFDGRIYGRYDLVYLHAWQFRGTSDGAVTHQPKKRIRHVNGIVYFREGRAVIRETESGRTMKVGPGDLVLFPMGVPYSITWEPGVRVHDLADFLFDYNCHIPYRSERGRTDWDTIRMSQKDALPSFLPSERITRIVSEPASGAPSGIMQALIGAYHAADEYAAFQVNARFYDLIDYVHTALYPSEAIPAGGEIDRARLYIEAHCTEEFSIAELARQHSLDRSYFSRRFKEIVGIPPITYKNRCRMLLAQEMLIGTTDSVAQIADLLGFSSEAHFRECFRGEYGQSPLKFRKDNTQV